MAYEKNKKKKAKKKKAKTKKGNMKQHEKHHSKKHMNVMKKFMSGGLSMDKAHNLATRMIGK